MVLGGEVPQEMRTNSENEAYDPKTNAWRKLADAGRPARGRRGALGDAVYVVGGSLRPGAGQVTDQLIVFNIRDLRPGFPEHFQEKWNPVFRSKMRPTQERQSTFSF
jgi:hypothetical protein